MFSSAKERLKGAYGGQISKGILYTAALRLADETPNQAEKELAEYFQGKRRVFSLPFVQTGTVFELAVWSVLIDIPYGRTISYKMQAEKMARAQAFRAVGTANGKNPLPIIVPCHRVLRSDFGLGGYAGGLWMKEWLLAYEKKHC